MFSHLKLQAAFGAILTAVGLVGIFISFSVQKSDVDPTALMIAFVSISVSIIGISLIIENPTSPKSESSESNHKLEPHR
jgi:uncharacterized membrane protein YczE